MGFISQLYKTKKQNMIEFTLGVVSTVVLAAFIWSLIELRKQQKHIKALEESVKYNNTEISRCVDQFYRHREDDRRSFQDQFNSFERYMNDHFVKKPESSKQILNG